MFQLGALHAYVDRLGLSGFELGFRLKNVRPGYDAACIAVPGQFEGLSEGGDRRIEKLFLRVKRAELKVKLRERGLDAQAGRCQISRACLCAGPVGLYVSADPPPEVRFPGYVNGQQVVGKGVCRT